MGASIWVGNNADRLVEGVDAMNRLIAHQNAAIDLIASDKRAALVTNMAAVAQLCANGEILDVMNYGDAIHPEWVDGETHYNPEMNLCHVGTALLEDQEEITGAYFEWDKTIPFNMPFDAREAIYCFDGTEGAGDHYITVGAAYSTGWPTEENIQITLTEAPDEGDQLVLGSDADKTSPIGLTWNVYAAGDTTVKQTGTAARGTSGTQLGTTSANSPHKTNGKVNAISRSCYGYNRWSQSGLRQWLNSTDAAFVWTPQNMWDRPASEYASKAGFLYKYGADVYRYFKAIKHVTVTCDADENVEDITYDRVFVASLEQIYCNPQFSGKEGGFWEYYKQLQGRTTPAPTSQTYPRLKKYALNEPTSARYRFLRSALRGYASHVWYVYSSGGVYTSIAGLGHRCAPASFISN